MKIARFSYGGATSTGIVVNELVYDLVSFVPDAPPDIAAILAAGPALLEGIRRAFGGSASLLAGIPLSAVKLLAPIPHPSKYLAIGLNYEDHAEEARKAGMAIPATQVWFNKQVSCITGPFDPVVLPRVSDKLDYEAELGVVIGRRCRHVAVADAASVIGGYFIANDVTVRDWQQRSPTWTLGKSFDTHGPTGPWIVTGDEIKDPHALEMRLTVNGQQRQRQSTGKMIYNVYEQIAYLTQVMTLEPGDLIATGTPSGVGIATQQFLRAGDVVRVEIEQLGYIENLIVAEA